MEIHPSPPSLHEACAIRPSDATLAPTRRKVAHLSENSFGAFLPSPAYTRLKRAIDLGAAVLALPLLLPLFAVIALAIRLDSPGPAFFRQQRMGYAPRRAPERRAVHLGEMRPKEHPYHAGGKFNAALQLTFIPTTC